VGSNYGKTTGDAKSSRRRKMGLWQAGVEFTYVKQKLWQRIDACVSKPLYEVITLPADLLAIATQKLGNAKYRGSQILPRAYPPQREIGAGFCCLTG
jgi:hypothetical protein